MTIKKPLWIIAEENAEKERQNVIDMIEFEEKQSNGKPKQKKTS